jgi:pimeloyl-ACP methyl ester carboxylesterase
MLVLSLALAGSAAAVEFTPCPDHFGFSCATVVVPLDPSGQVPGTVSLKVERKQVGVNPSQSALIALSGGPGQAAIPSAEDILKSMAPALTTRDLVVFDQRGTGQSGPLNCPALNTEPTSPSSDGIEQVFETCALQLGAARGLFTTSDSVEDIEAIRRALGYQKLVLRGVSYGTKVALQYAERYPQNVEALVLDSVVASNGPDPLELPTYPAIRSVLDELCSGGACARISSAPLSELAQLAAQLHSHTLSGSVYDGSGHRHSSSIGELGLLNILEAGDLNPALRGLLPAAVRSALRHDPQPLLRLSLLASGLAPSLPASSTTTAATATAAAKAAIASAATTASTAATASDNEADEEGNALYWATRCEETPFPWGRANAPATRMAEANAALAALPSADFYPFDVQTALGHSLLPECVAWPDASPAPRSTPGPLPNVPTLILSGDQDLRTPTSTARSVAALIPDAQLLSVPYTGHSVLGTDFSGCAAAAVAAFFAGSPVQACKPTTNLFAPVAVTPSKLEYVHPTPGVAGRDGRTLTATLDTIIDVSRELIGATLQTNETLPAGTSFGGLRGGYARISSSAVRLSHYDLVPGVTLSGSFPLHDGKLGSATVRIEGSAAAHGTVRIGTGTIVSGTLGGKHFNVRISKATLSRAGLSDGSWPTTLQGFPYPALAGHTSSR